ncbi:phenylacetic acid degradation-related protein [Solidesulfovibrio carbinoliphilus subsp. oakridgensis]|uniref:Phenylacetic acid degradation-related protein n=1 Tax=Solidesulfovibrio carbinoliphilus subsp. oakridgensis TaxID=694327 RepID=G7Q7F6_9BACT|nr:PaaI family thioesterase [Solidesulfovibrio carbinoliphilus]EHJ47109.1 phenylacetic acid degradation-related protein [Solidesulfovibrio carbinoliphilus subsp. oakridgensis]
MDMQWFLERDPFAGLLGIRLVEAAPGYAKTAMDLTDRHKNGAGVAHGGAVFSLADLAFAVAANSHGKLSLAVAASISYVKAGTGKTLYAEAREVSLGGKMATYAITITNDAGDAVAAFQGTVYRKDMPYTKETA